MTHARLKVRFCSIYKPTLEICSSLFSFIFSLQSNFPKKFSLEEEQEEVEEEEEFSSKQWRLY